MPVKKGFSLTYDTRQRALDLYDALADGFTGSVLSLNDLVDLAWGDCPTKERMLVKALSHKGPLGEVLHKTKHIARRNGMQFTAVPEEVNGRLRWCGQWALQPAVHHAVRHHEARLVAISGEHHTTLTEMQTFDTPEVVPLRKAVKKTITATTTTKKEAAKLSPSLVRTKLSDIGVETEAVHA